MDWKRIKRSLTDFPNNSTRAALDSELVALAVRRAEAFHADGRLEVGCSPTELVPPSRKKRSAVSSQVMSLMRAHGSQKVMSLIRLMTCELRNLVVAPQHFGGMNEEGGAAPAPPTRPVRRRNAALKCALLEVRKFALLPQLFIHFRSVRFSRFSKGSPRSGCAGTDGDFAASRCGRHD